MSITEIKKILRECGLLLTGRKQELEARLLRLETLTCTKDDFPYKKISDKYKEKLEKENQRVNINNDDESPGLNDESQKEECCICMDDIDCDVYKTKCNHHFHKECMESWLKNSSTCPICRSQVGSKVVKQKVPVYYTDGWYGVDRDINNPMNDSSSISEIVDRFTQRMTILFPNHIVRLRLLHEVDFEETFQIIRDFYERRGIQINDDFESEIDSLSRMFRFQERL